MSKQADPCETYGLKFYIEDEIVAIVSDTKYFDELIDAYKDATVLVLGVVFKERRDFEHLCLDDAKEIISKINPKKTKPISIPNQGIICPVRYPGR